MFKKLLLAGCGGTVAAFCIAGCAAACFFLCSGLGPELKRAGDGVAESMTKKIARTYGENDNLWSQADVKRVSEAAVRAALQHPNDATILVAKASRLENSRISSGKIAWTCRGTVNAPLDGITLDDWVVAMVLENKTEKRWKVALVTVGDKEFRPVEQ